MRILKRIVLSAALAAGTGLLSAESVLAMPFGLTGTGPEFAARLGDTSPLQEVRYYRRGRGVGVGIATGLLLGGIIASQPNYYYGGYPAYPAYGPYSPGDPAIAYCMSRFRSYDPYTMTYLGFDGYRHSCP